MPTEPKLEAYLGLLEKSLSQIPVSDRADIITEIRSHVLEAQEREPGRRLEEILASLGEPEITANRYLMERGLKPGRAPKTPMVKWLTIGFLGTIGMGMFFILVVIWKFTPIIKVDDQTGRVQFLGGLIDIASNDKEGSHSWFNFNFDSAGGRSFFGSQNVGPNDKIVKIKFSNGKFSVEPTAEKKISWECKTDTKGPSQVPAKIDSGIEFVFVNAKCELRVPEKMAVEMEGNNGKIDLQKPMGNFRVKMNNGKLGIEPKENTAYKYDLKVGNGKIDRFESSEKPGAILISADIGNGAIAQD